jgi:hypothetical protein
VAACSPKRVGVDEAALEALDEFFVAPVSRDAGGEDAAHAAAANEIDWDAMLAQRSHDAEVGEAARAAARKARGRPRGRQEAHQAVVVRRPPHVVMRHVWQHAMPACRGAVCKTFSCSSSSSARRMLPSSHCERAQPLLSTFVRATSRTTSAWRRQSRVQGVSPASAA